MQELKNTAYQGRLKILRLYSLERWRYKVTFKIEMYKIPTGKENVDYRQFFTLVPTHHNTIDNTREQPVQAVLVRLQKQPMSQTEVLQSAISQW